MTPYPEIRKPVTIRSALPSGVICKGAVMPPYFNLLLVISSYLHRVLKFFVQIAHGEILCFHIGIGRRGNTGFTGDFRYLSPLALETVRMVCKSQILEQGRGTCLR